MRHPLDATRRLFYARTGMARGVRINLALARTVLRAHLVEDAVATEAAADGVLWFDLIDDTAVAAEIVGHDGPAVGREGDTQCAVSGRGMKV